MNLSSRIEQDYIAAYKAKDSLRLNVLRLIKTAAKNRQVELMRPLDEGELLDVLAKQCKQRQDSIEQFSAAGRMDLADKEKAELDVLRAYMPEAMDEAAIRKAVDEAVAALGATGPKDMGRVMQALMQPLKGRADGKLLSELVKAKLQSL